LSVTDICSYINELKNNSSYFSTKYNIYFLERFACTLQRNGADYAVFINTASEFDGSDSGARPDEAVSWGKIKKDASPVKVYKSPLFL
jgi:hypothetical protein